MTQIALAEPIFLQKGNVNDPLIYTAREARDYLVRAGRDSSQIARLSVRTLTLAMRRRMGRDGFGLIVVEESGS